MLLVTILAAAFVACGGDDVAPAPNTTGKNAGDTALALLQMVDKGQWGPEWDALHPSQQALITRDAYIACASKKSNIPPLSEIKVVETYQEDVAIPGTAVRGPSTAVTLQYTGTVGSQSTTTKSTFHMFNVDGKWRWMLADPATCK